MTDAYDDLFAILEECRQIVYDAQKPGHAPKPAFTAALGLDWLPKHDLNQLQMLGVVTGMPDLHDDCYAAAPPGVAAGAAATAGPRARV